MEVTVQAEVLALFIFLLGVVCARLVPYAAAHASERRDRRRFVQFVQPKRFGSAPPPLADAVLHGVGLSIHQTLMQQDDNCEKTSLSRFPRLGEKTPRCYEMMGRVLALLDALSSCAWGCAEGDHVLERLIGRSVNHARAGLRLALMGFYDEALALIRGVGEIANLLSLFEAKTGSFTRWKSLDERTRRREFSPANVRDKLEKIGTPIRVNTDKYAELSSRNVHVNPRTSPQAYDMLAIPKGGAYYQEAGLIICLNELALALTFVTYAAAKLSHVDQAMKQRMFVAGRDLILHTGRLGIENMQEMWAELMKKGSTSPT
jgi:hypothetical protein